MDPHDQADVMHLQDSRSSALDLSVGCRHTNPMEALDLVKKPSWCGLTSGSRSVNLSESCYIKQTPPHHPEPEEKFHGTPAHDSYSIPLPLINGLPSVAQILSQCSSTDQEFTDYHEEMEEEEEEEEVLMQTKQCHKNAESVLENSILGGRIAHVVLEKHPQDIGSDTVFTKGSSFLSQGSSPAANTLHSTSSAAEQTAIETLASECTKISTESTSSDSDSDVIEVPVSNSRCTTRPNLRPRPTSVIVSDTSGRTLRSSRLKQQVDADRQMNCSPKNVNSIYTMDEAVYETANRRVGAESKSLLSWMESVLIPISPEDSEQDTNSSFPKNLPSTSDAENSSVLKSPETQRSSSSTPSHQEKTPPLKSRKQAKPRPKARPKPRPKPKKQQKRVTPGTKTIKKRRRRKPQPSGPSSMFSPKEPEIKLRFANHKNEKKEARTAVDCFVPYIRMEFSSCTIVNFREEEVVSKKSSHPADSGVIPKTSCLQLGRIGSDARLQETRFCCLCGRTGNVEGLGDLHGPYHRSGAQPICKVDSSPPPVSKQEPDCSDVDSLYSLEDGASQAKRQRKENGSESLEESGVPGEHWIHEDCSIWTAGIFLVKGKLYGLEEAIRLAQGTVCSFCNRVGATLGCFFKDCPQKYHCPCALQSGSALNEENFTMRCPKHKNKVSRMSVSRLKNR